MISKKAIFWDNDGILVDTETLYFEATRDVLCEVGVNLTEDIFSEVNLKDSRGAWYLAEEAGIEAVEIEQLRIIRNTRYTELVSSRHLAIPGAEEVLAMLNSKVCMGIVTSCSREHFYAIHKPLGLLPLVDFILVREDYRLSKPDPEPYLLALSKAGVKPEDALVIEDSERGLVAAKRAGLECWVIPCGLSKNGDFKEADRVLKNITDVPNILFSR